MVIQGIAMTPQPADGPPGRKAPPPWQPSIGTISGPLQTSSRSPDGVWFLPPNWNRAVAILVWGGPQPIVNRLIFSMARSLDPTPLWLEVSQRGEQPEPLRLGWLPPEQVYVSERPEDLETSRAVGNLALWGIVRSDEPATTLARLTDFVRLPPLVQQVLGGSTDDGRLRALAVGNADRMAHLFRERPEELQWLVDYLREASLCLIVGASGPPSAGRGTFDCEYRVEGSTMSNWREATIVCDRSRLGSSQGVGRARRIDQIPGLASLFEPPA